MEIVLLTLSFLTLGVLLFLYFKKQGSNGLSVELRELIKKELYQNREELSKNLRESRLEITQSMERLNEVLAKKAKEDREELRNNLKDFQEAFSKNVTAFNELQKQNFERLNQKQDELVKSTELKLEKMRETVDEKLHKTLEERLGKSFEVVTQQLLRVQKGLGEMQTLAAGVGDLKKVLSNVKTSGVLGEIQLGNILEQILAPEQYDANVKTKKGSDALVEYAIKLPGKSHSNRPVYLPVDAKFPQEDYNRLQLAYEAGDPEAIEGSLAALLNTVKKFAKDISQRYIDPPHTTDFGGEMTHGQNYLFENLPYTKKKISVTTLSESKRSNNDSLFVYEDLIHPVMEEKCIACHNQNLASGGLNMSSIESMSL